MTDRSLLVSMNPFPQLHAVPFHPKEDYSIAHWIQRHAGYLSP